MNILPELSEGLDMLLTQLVKRYLFHNIYLIQVVEMFTYYRSFIVSQILYKFVLLYLFLIAPLYGVKLSSFVIEKQPPQVINLSSY